MINWSFEIECFLHSIFETCCGSYAYEGNESLCRQEEKATFETINQNSFSLNGLKELINRKFKRFLSDRSIEDYRRLKTHRP